MGFDNLLYISIESKRAPLERQAEVRRWGIGIAILLRIVLLYIVIKLIHSFHNTILHIGFTNIIEGEFNLHSIIMIFGGIFIIYTAMKEILHMMVLSAHGPEEQNSKSVGMIIFLIVSMNVVFSFDSILSAMALTEVFWNYAIIRWRSHGAPAFIRVCNYANEQGYILFHHRNPDIDRYCPEQISKKTFNVF